MQEFFCTSLYCIPIVSGSLGPSFAAVKTKSRAKRASCFNVIAGDDQSCE